MSDDSSSSEPQLQQNTSEHIVPSQLSRANVCGLSRKVSTELKTKRWSKRLEKDCEARCFVLIIRIPVSVKTSRAGTGPDIYRRPISVYGGKTCFEDQ